MNRLLKLLEPIWLRLCSHRFYVIADCHDNSITLSKALFKYMNVYKQDEAKVYVTKVEDYYAFVINPPIEQPTQLADIQYNAKYKTIGFESLCPTVNRIVYDYGLPANTRIKLSIKILHTKENNITYYLICKPNNARYNM